MTTRCKSTLSRRARGRAKENIKTRKEIARTTQATQVMQTSTLCKNCGRTGHWAKDCWRPGGEAYDNSTRNDTYTQKGNNHKKDKGKGKLVDVVETNQSSETVSTVSYPSRRPSTIGALSCNPGVEQKCWIIGCDNQFRVFHKETSSCRVFASSQWRTASRMSDQVSRTKKSTVA